MILQLFFIFLRIKYYKHPIDCETLIYNNLKNITGVTINSINQILTLFQSHSLTNIWIVGYIDSDDHIKRFNPIEKDIYLEFGEA